MKKMTTKQYEDFSMNGKVEIVSESKHDDIHDTCIQALLRIRDGFLVTHPDDPDDEDYEQERYIKKDKHYYS